VSTYAELLDEVAQPPPFGSRTGVGITPVLCNGDEWGSLQAGLDQIEVAVQLTPAGRRMVESNLVLKPTRYGRLLCGTERNGTWAKFLGVTTLYDPRHGTVAYDFHPHEPGGLAPLTGWTEIVAGELNRRVALGLSYEGWAIVKRADVGIDVGFRDPQLGRTFYEALRDRRYSRGRRVQERQPGWFSILGRGTRQPVMHGRVYDKGVETRRVPPWCWIRTERVMRWERRQAMRLSLLTAGALCHAYDDVFVDGLAAGPIVVGEMADSRLVQARLDGRLSLRQYEWAAGYLLAERLGRVREVYASRPDVVSRSERLARDLGLGRDGRQRTTFSTLDLREIVLSGRVLLAYGTGEVQAA
jgi:hypothetical protein